MDKYVKQRKIGEGAFGKAILVKRKEDAKQYVIKEINIIRMSPKERQDSKKEVAVLAQLHHPNIVHYRESFEEAGSLYIVMDFCEKGDLYSKINSQRGALFPEDQVMDWFVQICLAIKHIHDRKILHRDIKSQNIFLSADGSVKLGDFGIAKVLGSTVELARTCIGTPYYLSPEMCENRPYNNKSDIWSLGCVLYELATLKHAFEAGNMKNLVLKIIRGSYPPISPKYSYDLRGLISQLFKRSPKERPSVNSILKKPFVQRRVTKFLTEDQIASEFSHTVMHGQKLARALPPPPPVSKPPAVKKATPARPPQRYNPASIYGAPVARKSKDNRISQDKNRPGSANSRPNSARSRPGSAGGAKPVNSSQDLKRKRQELVEKERKRLEEENKAAMERKHREMLEKQKMARINKAREEGWKNMVDSLGSGDSDNKNGNKGQQRDQIKWPPPQPAEPNIGARDPGKYEQYHAYLDKLQQNQEERRRKELQQQVKPQAAYMAAPRIANPPKPIPNWNRPGGRTPVATPVYQKPDQGVIKPAQKADDKSERARIVDEFIARKREAALNRQRGHFDIFGNPMGGSPGQKPQDSQDDQEPPSSAREREEQEYLDRLRQIRQNNYRDRKNIQDRQRDDASAKNDAEMRKKKIEALRQQADDRARLLRQQLDQQRRELFDRDRHLKDRQAKKYEGNRPVPAPRPIGIKPAPAAGITGALNAIGAEPPKPQPHPDAAPAVGMTGILNAIGAKSKTPEPVSTEKSNLQKQKEEILKRLNQKGDPRGKWGAPAKPEVKEESPVPDSARSKWGEGEGLKLENLPLEQTASQMEVTSARDQVVKHRSTEENKDSDAAAAAAAAVSRRQWGRPSSTVVRALKDAPIMEGTMSSDKSDDSIQTPESPSTEAAKAIGSTVTISKPAIQKGTIVIKGAGDKITEKEENSKQIGATITLDKPVICKVPPNLSNVLEKSESPADQNQSESTTKETTNKDSKPTTQESSDPKIDQSKPSTDTSQSPSSEQAIEAPNKLQSQTENEVDRKKPPVPIKPTTASKPLVLPKPVLLKKPDAPYASQGKVQEAVNSEGEGSLFEKVESKEEENRSKLTEQKTGNDIKSVASKTTERKGDKKNTSLLLGLTAGQFDIGIAQMLRTCSEPDLSKLSDAAEKKSIMDRTRRQSCDDLDKLKEEDEAMVANMLANVLLDESDNDEESEDVADQMKLNLDYKSEDKSQSPRDSSKEGDDADVEEQDDDIDDEDYEDLLSVRETMQSLLLQEYSTDDDGSNEAAKFRLSSSKEVDIQEEAQNDVSSNSVKEEKSDDKSNDDNKDDEQNESGKVNSDDDVLTANKKIDEVPNDQDFDEGDDFDDDNGEDEVEEENGNEDDNVVGRSISVDSENISDPASDLFQSDESDVDTQFGDDDDGYDLFGRLEESRAELETELGCDKFLKVYKTVQALQEDEDENIEEGAKLVTKILGQEKEHLYPKIFQLVMADAAFTEDNF